VRIALPGLSCVTEGASGEGCQHRRLVARETAEDAALPARGACRKNRYLSSTTFLPGTGAGLFYLELHNTWRAPLDGGEPAASGGQPVRIAFLLQPVQPEDLAPRTNPVRDEGIVRSRARDMSIALSWVTDQATRLLPFLRVGHLSVKLQRRSRSAEGWNRWRAPPAAYADGCFVGLPIRWRPGKHSAQLGHVRPFTHRAGEAQTPTGRNRAVAEPGGKAR
jgi:hypothetical protein